MNGTHILAFTAIIFYLAAALLVARKLFGDQIIEQQDKRLALSLGFAGIVLHAVLLHQGMVADQGINLSVTNAGSLVGWLIATLLFAGSIRQPMESMALIFFPVAALCLGLEQLLPEQVLIAKNHHAGIQLHILFSILSYSLLSIAALQALLLAFADARLRRRHPVPIMRLLPPLQTMETLLFRIIWLGFVLLSLALISGFHYVEDMMAQHLVHKTVLSIIAWIVFAILLWGRYRYGWRGRTAIRFTLAGMVTLLLAYFGSKAVLELILNKV